MALFVNGDNVTLFDSFDVEYIPKEIKNFKANKNITANIYRIQANDSACVDTFVINLLILY